jgi:3-oxoacyl-[acyl-carrier protein] reductase
MQAGKWGRVVNFTGGSEPRAINAGNAAKAVVHAWAKGLSREVAKKGITVNKIKPGRIISDQVLRVWPTEADQLAFETEIPIGRFGQAEEVVVAGVFLCSPVARYVTGASIPVDSGFSHCAFRGRCCDLG